MNEEQITALNILKNENNVEYTLLLNGVIPLTFTIAKKYAIGTGYVALFSETEKICILCRYLETGSTLDDKHVLIECSKDPLDNEKEVKKTRSVIILHDDVGDFANADKIIKSYNRAFIEFEKLQ